MAARTCSRAVTQTARNGAHQGAARRQARKMLRQVSEPIKNTRASSMPCDPARNRGLPYRLSPRDMRPGERLPDKYAVSRQRASHVVRGAPCRPGAMTRERRTGQARPAVSCGPHFSPRKDFLTLPFPGRAGKSFPVRRPCLMHRHPGCSDGQHRTRAFPCTVRENGESPPEGHACSSQRHESLAAAPAWHQNREELLPLPVHTTWSFSPRSCPAWLPVC